MMRPGRSAFLIGCLVAALGLSPLLGCVVAPPEPDEETLEVESELDSDAADPDPSDDADDLTGGEDDPDPLPWKPGLRSAPEEEPGLLQVEPDPVPWQPDPDSDSSDRSGSAP